MTEIIKFDAYKKKLQGICDENDLIYKLDCNTYPLTLTIQPLDGLDEPSLFEQEGLFKQDEEAPEPANSPDASIMFFYQDGAMVYRMSERFTINDTLFAKIKNLFKNLHYTYLQFFHREVIEKRLIQSGLMPSPDDYEQSIFPQLLDGDPEDEEDGEG